MIDFFARWEHYLDHMLPIYMKLGSQAGRVLVPRPLGAYCYRLGIEPTILEPNMQEQWSNVTPFGDDPVLVAGHADLISVTTTNPKRPTILMEHGVGLVFPGNASYAGNIGYRASVDLTLAPNKVIYEKTASVLPEKAQEIIGTPKLDWVANFQQPKHTRPVVAVAFHWDASGIAPEAGTAFGYYRSKLQTLTQNKDIEWIAHGHPRAKHLYKPFFERWGYRWVDNFAEVLAYADLYVNDCSSTMYEFIATGKPVVILNAPQFRKDVDFGIRFWQYTDIGIQVDRLEDIEDAIDVTLKSPRRHIKERTRAVEDLFPWLGSSAARAASVLKERYG